MTKVHLLGANRSYDRSVQTVSVNQVVVLEGYNYDSYVMYEVTRNKWRITYHLINLLTYEFHTSDLIRPLSEKFGIGIYYDDAKAVIIGELRVSECESYTDYYDYRIERTVILGFSTHTRNLFPEMYKYAANFERTAYLAEYDKEYEHHENYSMGRHVFGMQQVQQLDDFKRRNLRP